MTTPSNVIPLHTNKRPVAFNMKGLIKKLALDVILDESKLNNTSYTSTITSTITSTLVLVNGVLVNQSSPNKEGKVEYIFQIDCLEYKLSGIEDKDCDIQIKLTDKENQPDGFGSLKEYSILAAYYFIRFLEANMASFPQFKNVIRSYINDFFGAIISARAKYNGYEREPYYNILICDHFYITYYYGFGLTFNSIYGDFVLGHRLHDMNPRAIAMLAYIHNYGEKQTTSSIRLIQPIFKKYFECNYIFKKYFENIYNDCGFIEDEGSAIPLQSYFEKFKNVASNNVDSYVMAAFYDNLDDERTLRNVSDVFKEAVSFYNTNSI